jgi:restriction system protein
MIRAGNDNELVEEFRCKSLVAVGWGNLGDVSDISSADEMKNRFISIKECAKNNKLRIAQNAGQMYRFAQVIEKGDFVLTYDQTEREYLIGIITSEYEWAPDDQPQGYPHVRRVKWEDTVSRDEFSMLTKNKLKSMLTVFSLDDCLDEITDKLNE